MMNFGTDEMYRRMTNRSFEIWANRFARENTHLRSPGYARIATYEHTNHHYQYASEGGAFSFHPVFPAPPFYISIMDFDTF